jgi:hypothetical protein
MKWRSALPLSPRNLKGKNDSHQERFLQVTADWKRAKSGSMRQSRGRMARASKNPGWGRETASAPSPVFRCPLPPFAASK